jgi:hypothetical protein
MRYRAKPSGRPPNILLTSSRRGFPRLPASMLEVYHVLWVSVPVLCLHNLECAPNFIALGFLVQRGVEGHLTYCLIFTYDEINTHSL